MKKNQIENYLENECSFRDYQVRDASEFRKLSVAGSINLLDPDKHEIDDALVVRMKSAKTAALTTSTSTLCVWVVGNNWSLRTTTTKTMERIDNNEKANRISRTCGINVRFRLRIQHGLQSRFPVCEATQLYLRILRRRNATRECLR